MPLDKIHLYSFYYTDLVLGLYKVITKYNYFKLCSPPGISNEMSTSNFRHTLPRYSYVFRTFTVMI